MFLTFSHHCPGLSPHFDSCPCPDLCPPFCSRLPQIRSGLALILALPLALIFVLNSHSHPRSHPCQSPRAGRPPTCQERPTTGAAFKTDVNLMALCRLRAADRPQLEKENPFDVFSPLISALALAHSICSRGQPHHDTQNCISQALELFKP